MRGVDIDFAERMFSFKFKPSDKILKAIENNLLKIDASKLYLDEKEWFRETAWCLEVIGCFMQSR